VTIQRPIRWRILVDWTAVILDDQLVGRAQGAIRSAATSPESALTTGGRQRRLRIPSNWPWATAIVNAFARIAAIPAPG